MVAAFAEVVIKDAHAAMLSTKAPSGDATLGELPACTDHDRKPGGDRLKIGKLVKCAICGPWMLALAATAGVNSSTKQLSKVLNVRPCTRTNVGT